MGGGWRATVITECRLGGRVKPIRVLIADDHALVRAGFHTLLQRLPDVEVVAEAEDGREVLDLVAERRPDVVLMDISMPHLNGLETTVRLRDKVPEVRVIILSMHTDEEYVGQALRAGADGYLLKSSDAMELRIALKAVVEGQTYLSPPVSSHVVSSYVERTEEGLDAFEQLTPRQREVLQLIAEGYTSRQIAHQLGITLKTVEAHRRGLRERLDIHDVAGLVRYAIRVGLTSAEP
jgi:DNA-binding NarL/FixJ family response regulator